jgi:uncharacterized damage-inducible protein DinB
MDAFLAATIEMFRKQKNLAERARVQVDDEQLHQEIAPDTNSVAVILKHMAGNMRSRWTNFLTSDGEKPWRNRDDEFIDTLVSRAEMMDVWNAGWTCLLQAVSGLADEDLIGSVAIRGEQLSVAQAMLRQVDHYAYHVGQIVLICRILAGDRWQVLSIPRGESQQFNERVWKGPG